MEEVGHWECAVERCHLSLESLYFSLLPSCHEVSISVWPHVIAMMFQPCLRPTAMESVDHGWKLSQKKSFILKLFLTLFCHNGKKATNKDHTI
jgi:hypothetical protein